VLSFTPPGPGVLLLCSDGLWNYQPEAAKLAELALPQALTDPLGAAQALVKFAIDAGGMDNVTVIVAPLPLTPASHRAPAPSAPPESEEKSPDE
jgi:serine/threonine protein phosphatase PrpC